jgi:carbamate kinase
MNELALVALGGNALDASGNGRVAAELLARMAPAYRLVVTHGNGPQVGLLALDADGDPLDVLDAETEGQIGYALALELDNATTGLDTVAVLTRVVVDAQDPAFQKPTKPIGRGDRRRLVPSPEPARIVELRAIRQLLDAGFLVVCAGGGGIPVVEDGGYHGVEAVIDKDLASALLARQLGASTLVLATNVDAVYDGYGTASQRPLARATPRELRARSFAAGSMGPKVEAVCRFVERTGGRGVIGSLEQIDELLGGRAGTQVLPDGSELEYEGIDDE